MIRFGKPAPGRLIAAAAAVAFCCALAAAPRFAVAGDSPGSPDPAASAPAGAPTASSASPSAPSAPDSTSSAQATRDPAPSAKEAADSAGVSPAPPPPAAPPGQGVEPPASKPQGEKSASDRSSAEKAAPEKAAPEKAAPEKAAPEKPAQGKPAQEKPSTDKIASEKAPLEKSGGEKAPADKTPADKTPAEKPAGEKSAPEKSSGEKSAPEKSSGEKASAEKAADVKASAGGSSGEKAAADKAPGEKAAAQKPAGGKAAAAGPKLQKPASSKGASDGSSLRKPAPAKRGAARSKPAGGAVSGAKVQGVKGGSETTSGKRARGKLGGSQHATGPSDAPPQARHGAPSGTSSLASSPNDGSEAEHVAREIERTATWMTRAHAVVPRTHNPRAMDLLGSADQFQQDARDAYELRQFARAQRLTLAARDYADRSGRIVGPATDDPEYVQSALERTDDALDRLKDVLRSSEGSRDRTQYESLKDDQKDAWKRLHDGDVRGAYAATSRVRDGVLSVLQGLPEVPISCDAAEKAVKSAERARDKAADDLGAKPGGEASKRLAQADGQLSKARTFLARGDCREALLRAKVAEQQLERAVDAARPTR